MSARTTGGRTYRGRPHDAGLVLPRGLLALGGLVLVLMVLVVVGCGGDESTVGSPDTTMVAAGAATTVATPEAEGGFGMGRDQAVPPVAEDKDAVASSPITTIPGSGGGVGAIEQSLDRKVISNASILLEVSEGTFQTTFDRALQLADKFGGYVVASSASAEEGEDVLRSGTITIRIPSQSFNQAVGDAGKLGEVKSQNIDTQDVTEEYVDLEARLVNAEAQESALLDLMDKAETIDEILQVQQYLAQIQMEIEQLKGRLRYLDEHTSYSTVTISIYESGTDVPDDDDWGFVTALKDALHAFVDGVNGIIVGVGAALPALIILAVLAYIAYRLVAPRVRRRQAERQAAWADAATRAPQPVPAYPMTQPYPATPPVTSNEAEAPQPAGTEEAPPRS